MELKDWYYGGQVPYWKSIPEISQKRLIELKESSQCKYIYSYYSISYDNLRPVGSRAEKFPSKTDLIECYVYELK